MQHLIQFQQATATFSFTPKDQL